jgi:hypothetical protein
MLVYTSLKCIQKKYTHKCNIKGAIQQYEIVQNAIWPPIKPKANHILTMRHNFLRQIQDLDQDMADSSSPANNKRDSSSPALATKENKKRPSNQT